LNNIEKNIYSFALKEKIEKMENKILSTIILISLSVKNKENIKKVLNLIANIEIFLMNNDNSKKEIKNYKRYLNMNYDTEGCCPICYSEEYTKTVLVCGHFFCIECFINFLSNSKKCPICSEYADINRMCIVKETIPNYSSEINLYLSNFKKSILITNSPSLFGFLNMFVIDLSTRNRIDTITITGIKDILILTTPYYKRKTEFYEILHYVKNLNPNACITELSILE
jgi:hypothetical protein